MMDVERAEHMPPKPMYPLMTQPVVLKEEPVAPTPSSQPPQQQPTQAQTTSQTQQTPAPPPATQTQPSAPASTDSKKPGTTPKVSQAAFIHKLYSMLEDSSIEHLISWSASNDSFIVSPGEEFSKVLRQYFKHTNVSSFVRQLNMYGFHKVNDTFTFHTGDSSQWEFKHGGGSFKRGDVESLRGIKRRASRQSASQRDSVPLRPVGLVTDYGVAPAAGAPPGMNGSVDVGAAAAAAAAQHGHMLLHPSHHPHHPHPADDAAAAAATAATWHLHDSVSRMAATQAALVDAVRSLQSDVISLLEVLPRITEGRAAVETAHTECQRVAHAMGHRNAFLASLDGRRESQPAPQQQQQPYFYQQSGSASSASSAGPVGSQWRGPEPQYPVPPTDPFHRGSRGRAVSVYFDPLAKEPAAGPEGQAAHTSAPPPPQQQQQQPGGPPFAQSPTAAGPPGAVPRSQRPGSFPLLHRQDKTEFVGGGFAEALKYRTDAPARRHTASGAETMPLPQYAAPTSTPHPHEPSTPPPHSSPHTPYRSPHPSGGSTRSNSSSSTRGASVAALLNPEGGDKKRKIE
ncbi:Transcription factor SFL1 [Yarrowia sp. B02]|nr:Transcription factor SFL1 [Yarrowia sp. B02]